MKFEIPIDVIPQGRPRFYNGVAVDPPKCRQFKEELAWKVKSLLTDHKLLTGKLRVHIEIFRNFRSETMKSYGDIDNLAKGILDALTGVVWKDDSQITRLEVDKNITDCKPYLIIWIEVIVNVQNF